AADQASGATFLERLRIVHPALAVLGGGFLLYAVSALAARARSSRTLRYARWVTSAVWVQFGLGGLNVVLSAPGFMQVLHLAAANVLWLCLVLLAESTLNLPNLGDLPISE